jgi:putative redox protein
VAEVIVRSRSGLTQQITLGPHTLTADEPRPAGVDLGPTPYDLLLSALGACTAMTVRLYADRKGWQLEGVEVKLRHDKIHAQDCAECETREGFLDRITKELTFTGELDQEQRLRLAEIAERCPVQRTLEREIAIEQSVTSATV